MNKVYCDFNATAPLRPEAYARMISVLPKVGNASSLHTFGRQARAEIEEARENFADLLEVPAPQIIFTSGGTEAAHLGLMPILRDNQDGRSPTRLFVSATEHTCIHQGHGFPASHVHPISVQENGHIDLALLAHLLERYGEEKILLALQGANNETGIIQPIQEAADLVSQKGGLILCDAVQCVSKMALSKIIHRVDLLLCSAHKFGGPQGVGCLLFNSKRLSLTSGLLRGGGQERGLRAGTENVVAIAGAGTAAQVVRHKKEQEIHLMRQLRDRWEKALQEMGEVIIFGQEVERLPNTSAFTLCPISAEHFLIAYDLAGIAVSSGAACSSGSIKPSHVLKAMQVPQEQIRGAIRVSFGWSSTEADVTALCETTERIIKNFRHK